MAINIPTPENTAILKRQYQGFFDAMNGEVGIQEAWSRCLIPKWNLKRSNTVHEK